MRKFKFNKLVRDDIALNIEKKGGKVIQKKLDDFEFLEQLNLKLVEEFTEYTKASKEEIVSELSDVYEVLENIRNTLHISEAEIKEARAKKAEKNGSFKDRVFIDYIEIENNDPWLQYYLDNKDRYPEIL